MKVKVKKLHTDAVIPTYAREGDAGLDLTAISEEIKDNGTVVYGTGLAFEIPKGYVGLLFPRSSSYKKDLRLSNSVGVVDSSYRGEVKFIYKTTKLWTNNLFDVGERVGQIVIVKHPYIELVESKNLSDTERGEGGFGSTVNNDYGKLV